ncbi:hypothetical protein [Tessaracoccus sp.]
MSPLPRPLRRRPPAEPAAAVPLFAFCEPVNALPMGREHLRLVGDEGFKFGGGAPGLALCGRDLMLGWDLERAVTVEVVTDLSSPRAGDGHVWLCPDCATGYLGRTTPPSS